MWSPATHGGFYRISSPLFANSDREMSMAFRGKRVFKVCTKYKFPVQFVSAAIRQAVRAIIPDPKWCLGPAIGRHQKMGVAARCYGASNREAHELVTAEEVRFAEWVPKLEGSEMARVRPAQDMKESQDPNSQLTAYLPWDSKLWKIWSVQDRCDIAGLGTNKSSILSVDSIFGNCRSKLLAFHTACSTLLSQNSLDRSRFAQLSSLEAWEPEGPLLVHPRP